MARPGIVGVGSQPPFFSCYVAGTGPAEDGGILIRLESTAGRFPLRWYRALDSMEREMLATALTAISSGLRVQAKLGPETGPMPPPEYQGVIERLYVIARSV